MSAFPVVILSGRVPRTSPPDGTRDLTYFTKPFDMSDLMGFIDRVLGNTDECDEDGPGDLSLASLPSLIAAVRAEPDHRSEQ